MKLTNPLLLIAAAIVSSTVLTAQTLDLESAPPVVVNTEPAAGSTDVNPSLLEIRVTFSKPMQDRSWSWCKWDKGVFPKMTGEARYLSDQRTCVLPVKLEPDTFYAIWLNTEHYKNFQDAGRRAAVPYLLTFSTGNTLSGATAKKSSDGSRVPGAVKDAVTTISQCTEADPRVATSIASLQSLDRDQVVAELSKYLDARQDTVRRSAVYILWMGKFNDINKAAGPLQKLLTHKEDLTRGMAALALGQNKIGESFDEIGAMLKKDKSGYARRCAAYALGLLGDLRAKPLLEAALKDSEAMVRNNATAALSMLESKQQSSRPIAPESRTPTENVAVEHVALRFLAAVRDKDDDVLKELSVDKIKGWRDSVAQFAFELRERFQQLTGKPLSLKVEESVVQGDYAAVKCTGPQELEGKHLVLFFVKTDQGWRNSFLRNSPPNISLREHLTYGIAQMEKAASSAADAAPSGKTPAVVGTMPIKGDDLPGKLTFHGRYQHRSRGSPIEAPSELWIKESPSGGINVLAQLPFSNSSELASANAQNQFTEYRVGRDVTNEVTSYRMDLSLSDGTVRFTRRGLRKDSDNTELKVPEGSLFDPNTRPDSYCAANILLRAFALTEGGSKEFRMFDWDNSGDRMVDYIVNVKHAGKERVEVPAGTFEANHLVLTQLTSADTWFKKRAGHVTEFWVLDNGIIVRVLRQREPYEMVLLDYTVPEKLPNQLAAKQPAGTEQSATVKDHSRAIALFNDIEDFGHECDAAFSSRNLAAAQTGIRRMTKLISDFNAEMDDPTNQFPPPILEELGKIAAALEAGDWEKARALAKHNQQFAERFQFIAQHIAGLALPQKLNDDQRAVLDWSDRQFRSYRDERTFATLSEPERAELETRLLDQLKGPLSREYYTAINSLAALRSKNAIEPLRAIAFDRAEKDNRDRWMAVRALGILDDKASAPELIHLVYHGNVNTRWWAQISLVRLTGQNFGSDWKVWGEWWNRMGGQPRFSPEMVQWSKDPEWSEPEKLKKNLAESDKKFLEQLRRDQ